MKICFNYIIRISVLALALNLGNARLKSTSHVLADATPEQQSSIVIQSGFRQLTNSQLDNLYPVPRPPGVSAMNPTGRPLPTRMESNQHRYNYVLQTLIWSRGRFRKDIWYGGTLDLSGLQKLEWVVKTNKPTYQLCEPIGISVSIRNISAEEIEVFGANVIQQFFLNSIEIKKIIKDTKQGVYLTKEGYRLYLQHPSSSTSFPYGSKGKLQPGDMFKIHSFAFPSTFQTLNPYYDLSEPGEYELTFYTRNFLGSDDEQIGEYPKPCTIRFKIEGNTNWLDSQVVWPEEDK